MVEALDVGLSAVVVQGAAGPLAFTVGLVEVAGLQPVKNLTDG